MEQLKIFNFENQEVRMQVVNEEPWFVGKGIAEVLGYSKTRNAIATHVDDEDKREAPIQGDLGGTQQTTIINESGLYSLILKSKLPSAKRFKRWVTSEVLPSIRKHGAYMTPDTLEQMLTNPDLLIGLATNLKEERVKRIKLETQIKEDSQYTAFGKIASNSSGAVKIGQFAKIVYDEHGVNLGQNNTFAWLRENGYLIKDGRDKNIPLQRYMENGYFEVRPTIVTTNQGNIQKGTPLITGKGQVAITKKLLAEFKPEMLGV